MKFSITDFFSKCDQIQRKVRIWSHSQKKSVMENFIFCKVALNQLVRMKKYKFRLIEKKTYTKKRGNILFYMTKVLKVIYGYMVLSAEKYHKTNIVFCLQVAFFSSLLSSLRKKHFNKIFYILQFLHRYHIFF